LFSRVLYRFWCRYEKDSRNQEKEKMFGKEKIQQRIKNSKEKNFMGNSKTPL